MRLIKQQIDRKTMSGSATLLPEEPEDMWHAYNLIRANDLLRASAVRRVTTESASGSSSSQRVHMTLTLRVSSLDFDPQAGELHVSGRVAEENKHVKMGQYHTLDLELHRNFTLEKADGWDSVALDTLKESINQEQKAELWAVVMQDGLANICLITAHQTILRQRIEVSLPKKRAGKPSSEHDKAVQRFFATVLDTLVRQLGTSAEKSGQSGREDVKPLLVASPGFTASSFAGFIKSQATAKMDKFLRALADKTIVAHAASGHLHALADVLANSAVMSKLSDTKFARETQLIDRFFELLRVDDGRAWYGPREVERAVEKGAVGRGGGTLLISNSLFRSQAISIRRRWVSLVDQVKDVEGGEVRVLSSMHESGKRLEGLGGIAAILTYPIEDLDVGEEELNGVNGAAVEDAPTQDGVADIEGRVEANADDFEF